MILIVLTVKSYGAEYYVAKNGRDSNAGTEEYPWLTIQLAADRASQGDTVYIKEGIYNEIISIKNSGMPEKYITFRSYPNNHVTIDGNGKAGWYGVINVQGKQYIKIEGLEIKNNDIGWGVLIEHAGEKASEYIELSGLDIHNTGSEDIQIRGNSHHISVSSCKVHDGIPYNGNVRSGIDIYTWNNGRPHHVNVSNCEIYNYDYDNKYNGVGGGIASEQADFLIIRNNKVYNCKQGIDIGSGDNNMVYDNAVFTCICGIALSSNENSEIFNNTVHDIYDEAIYSYYWVAHGEAHQNNKWYGNIVYNAGFAIYESNEKYAGKGIGPTSGHEYYHNLFYNIGTHGSYRPSFYFKGTQGIRFYHNTIYMNNNQEALYFTENATGADIRNNIFSVNGVDNAVRLDDSSSIGAQVDYNCYFNRNGNISGDGENSIFEDPKFQDVSNSNFDLRGDSPCIGKAIDLGTPYSYGNFGFSNSASQGASLLPPRNLRVVN